MRDEDLDIVELIINNMKTDTDLQMSIKLYMQTHKTNCNHYIYEHFKKETTFFYTILKSLQLDLGAEISRTLAMKNLI